MGGRDGEWQASAEGLAAYSQYTFRVRAVNEVGAGDWSEESDWARTDADVSYEPLSDEESVPGAITWRMLLRLRWHGADEALR